jgi:hypothetical protein
VAATLVVRMLELARYNSLNNAVMLVLMMMMMAVMLMVVFVC